MRSPRSPATSRSKRSTWLTRADGATRSHRLDAAKRETAFVALGLDRSALHLLTLDDRAAIEALMPADQPDGWKRLDVSVLQYGILEHVFGIDDAALAAGGAVSYTQDPAHRRRCRGARRGDAARSC